MSISVAPLVQLSRPPMGMEAIDPEALERKSSAHHSHDDELVPMTLLAPLTGVVGLSRALLP